MTIRVLQVYRDYFSVLHGGIERHVRDLAHGLQPEIQVEVLAAGRRLRRATIREEDVIIHMAPELVRIHGLPICPTFGHLMNEGNYDLIHLHLPTPMGQLGYALSRTTTPVVATYHADLHRGPARLRQLYNEALIRTLPKYRAVVASSWELVATSPVLNRLCSSHPHLVKVIPFGVDTDRFSPGATERSKGFRDRWGGGPIVLFVGRLADYKGLDVLIKAMREADATLVVAGVGVEEVRLVKLGAEVLGHRFIYLGDVAEEHLPDVYRAADVFCLPSVSSAEAFGLAALEALSCGVPAITTEVGTATSVVNRHRVTGLVAEPGNVDALAASIKQLLSNDAERAEFGRTAREHVTASYAESQMLSALAASYAETLSD